MVQINLTYQGDLRCEAVHSPSGTVLHTDAPIDNQGKGESFSPTDLVATALGTCILTTMGIVAKKLKVNMDGAWASTEKHMVKEPVRRIGELTVIIHMPTGIAEEHRAELERAGYNCPVHKSLHPDIQMPISFIWQ